MSLEGILGICFAAVMVGVLLTILFWALRANRKRRIALAKLAASLDMQYLPSNAEGDPRRLETFLRFFPHSKHHKFSQIIRGSFGGRQAEFCDCQYSQGRQGGLISLVVMDTGADFPHLGLWPESSSGKLLAASGLAKAVGFEDIDFESAEFSSRFYVTAKNRKFAYAVITPQMMEFLMGNTQWLCIEMLGSKANVCNFGQLDAGDLHRALQMLSGFLDRIPDYVWKDYAVGRGNAIDAR